MGIFTVMDLLEYVPFRYEDYTVRDLASVKDGDRVTVKGYIIGEPVLAALQRQIPAILQGDGR